MKKILILFSISVLLLLGCINLGGEKALGEKGKKNYTTKLEVTEERESVVGGEKGEGVRINMGYSATGNENLYIYFLDVGVREKQGDTVLLKKGDVDILIDTGPEESSGKLLDFLRSKIVDDIELVVLTVPKPEHYEGLDRLLDSYRVEEIWWNGDYHNQKRLKSILSKAKNIGIPILTVGLGFNKTIAGINFEVLNPLEEWFNQEDPGNDGIVLHIRDRNFTMITFSDTKGGAHGRLIAEIPDKLKADVMMVPSHGMGEGNKMLQALLEYVQPKYAVISGGEEAVESRSSVRNSLETDGIEYFETLNGVVVVATDGNEISLRYLK